MLRNLRVMKRSIFRWAAYLQIGLVLFTGCHPTQPFFVAEDGDLSHYLETATQIEYPDLHVESLPEQPHAAMPLWQATATSSIGI